MFAYNIGEEVIVKLKITKRKDTGQEKIYFLEGWVSEEDIVPIVGLDEAIEEARKEDILKHIPGNGNGESIQS